MNTIFPPPPQPSAGSLTSITSHTRIPFVSPFIDDQLAATRNVLGQVNPDGEISSAAIIQLMRFQDRLAHYLLERAYYKEDSEWSNQRGYKFALPEPIQSRSMTAPRSIGDCASHTILWRFPTSHLATGELGIHASSERIRHIEKLTMSFTKPESKEKEPKLVFEDSMAERWIHDFRMGLKMGNSANSSSSQVDVDLPADMISTDSCIGLLAMLEYITAEILELSSNSARDRNMEYITSLHLFAALRNDPELCRLLQFLPIEWSVGILPQDKVDNDFLSESGSDYILNRSHVGVESNALPSVEVMLKDTFATELQSYQSKSEAQDATSCWYDNPQRIREVAWQLVRGEPIDYSSIVLSLQKYHTRPYCYWGEKKDHSALNDRVPDLERWPERFSYTSFMVHDAADIDWHFLIELIWSESDQILRGRVFSLDAFDDRRRDHDSYMSLADFVSIGEFEPVGTQIEISLSKADQYLHKMVKKSVLSDSAASVPAALDVVMSVAGTSSAPPVSALNAANSIFARAETVSVAIASSVVPDDMIDIAYKPHGLVLSVSSNEYEEVRCDSSNTFLPLAASGFTKAVSVDFKTRYQDELKPSESILSATQKELECIIPHVLHIAVNHDSYSSSLYTATQSLSSRRRFTHVLIDESFISANQQGQIYSVMPSVLIDLMTEYHSFELPHLAEEMKNSASAITSATSSISVQSGSFSSDQPPTKKQKLDSTSGFSSFVSSFAPLPTAPARLPSSTSSNTTPVVAAPVSAIPDPKQKTLFGMWTKKK